MKIISLILLLVLSACSDSEWCNKTSGGGSANQCPLEKKEVVYKKELVTTIYELPNIYRECRTLPNGYSVRYLIVRVDIYSNPNCEWDDTLLGKVQCDNLVTDEPNEGDNGNDYCSVYIPDQNRLFQYSIIYNGPFMKLVETEFLEFNHIEL